MRTEMSMQQRVGCSRRGPEISKNSGLAVLADNWYFPKAYAPATELGLAQDARAGALGARSCSPKATQVIGWNDSFGIFRLETLGLESAEIGTNRIERIAPGLDVY
jgi:hypothetical protein